MDFHTHLQLLEILSWTLSEQICDPGMTVNQIDGRMLVRDAMNHSVLPLIVDGLLKQRSPSETEGIVGKYGMRQYKERIVMQAGKTAEFLLLYEYLAERGLHPLVLKGIVCRSLYPHPEHRASVDEDLLIDPELFSSYHQALLDYGLHCVNQPERINTDFEVSYENKENHLYIEVHKSLFSPESLAYEDLNGLFDGVLNRSEIQEICNTDIHTLNPTDHLLYIILHAFKHFLYSGFGIRQVCDIILFSEQFRDRIDWGRISQLLEQVHAKEFTAAVYRIGEEYLFKNNHMPEYLKGWDYKIIDIQPLLADIMDGGLYGASSKSRLHSSNITLSAVSAGRKQNGLLKSVFLPLQSMKGRYRYLNKAPFLLPIAWGQRVFTYLRETKHTSEDTMESIRIGAERVRLLEQYHIIPDKK